MAEKEFFFLFGGAEARLQAILFFTQGVGIEARKLGPEIKNLEQIPYMAEKEFFLFLWAEARLQPFCSS